MLAWPNCQSGGRMRQGQQVCPSSIRDPFNRVLVAQAQVEGLVILIRLSASNGVAALPA